MLVKLPIHTESSFNPRLKRFFSFFGEDLGEMGRLSKRKSPKLIILSKNNQIPTKWQKKRSVSNTDRFFLWILT